MKELLSNAPVESVVRVTGTVSPRPLGQQNPVRMGWGGSQGFHSLKETTLDGGIMVSEHCCVAAHPQIV